MDAVEQNSHDEDDAFEEERVKIELFSMFFVQDDKDLEQQNKDVLDDEQVC